MKSYELINKRDDAVLIRENGTLLEISVQIDTNKVNFRKVYKGTEVEYHARLLTHENDTLARWVSWANYVSLDAYTSACKLLNKNLREVKRIIKQGKNHPAYNAMLAIVKRDVESYQSDFTYHDTLRMGKDNNISFVWAVRSSGTWFLSEYDTFAISIFNYNEKHDYYIVENDEVMPCPKERAVNYLVSKSNYCLK